jgi:hypothetical protein
MGEFFMKAFFITAAALAFTAGMASAQQGDQTMSRPAVGMGSKTMDSCREDTAKYCATSSDYVRKECLVKNWDYISSDCQDALGKPFDGARRGGG